MLVVELNPLSPSVAIAEMVISLLGAALVGYLIGRWITKGQINELNQVLARKTEELDSCKALQENALPLQSNAATIPSLQTARPIRNDDLKKIEGIGPVIEKLLHEKDIYTFDQLASIDPELLAGILAEAGSRFQIHSPETWPAQAALARDEKWEELALLQERLSGGRM
jgi:predicted flap endonuclease-1-like 5' DNA nuclease